MSSIPSGAATSLQDAYSRWLEVSGDAALTLHEQTVAIVLRDRERLESLNARAAELFGNLRILDDHSTRVLEDLAIELQAEPKVQKVVQKLDKTEAERVHALANQVVVVSRTLHEINRKNHELAKRPPSPPRKRTRRTSSPS